MKPSELVSGALDLLADESDWCQGTLHRESTVHNKRQYCMAGALQASLGAPITEEMPIYKAALNAFKAAIMEQYHHVHVGVFNDNHTFEEVRAVMEKARGSLQEHGQ